MIERWKEMVSKVGERKLLIAIVGVSLVLQIVFMRHTLIYGEPYLIAKNIVAGKGFVFTYPLTGREAITCYATPLYTYIQAAILGAGLTETGIRIFNLLALQVACLVIYRQLRRFASADVAIVGFAVLSFYPPLWVLGYGLDPNTLNVLLLALTLEALMALANGLSIRRWTSLGVLIGIQLWLRPDILLGSVLFGLWLLYVHRREWKATLRGLALTAGVALLVIAPWTIRNYNVFHKFVLVSANAGFNLFVGNNVGATGEFAEVPQPSAEADRSFHDFLRYSQTHDQVEMDQYRFEQARQWMFAHPIDVLKLDARKFMFHWFGRSELGTQYHYAEGMFSTLYKVISAILIILAVYGLIALRSKHLRLLLMTLALYSTLVSVIFFVQSRHRTLKIDPFMVPLAAIGLVKFATRRAESISPLATLQIAE